ncbi:MAG: hypothetical protein ACYTFZ_08645, partial [Planctomycetota bacterium]
MRTRSAGWLVLMLVLLAAAPGLAWAPGGHAVVAKGVAYENGLTLPNNYLVLQAAYGAAAPDVAWSAEKPLRSSLGAATHDDPGYWEPWDLARPWSGVERSFA